jgi:hypothetical protein
MPGDRPCARRAALRPAEGGRRDAAILDELVGTAAIINGRAALDLALGGTLGAPSFGGLPPPTRSGSTCRNTASRCAKGGCARSWRATGWCWRISRSVAPTAS